MTKVEQIEKAVADLTVRELVQFRAWFEQFDAARFDAKLDRDIRAGKLEQYAREALQALHDGRTKGIS